MSDSEARRLRLEFADLQADVDRLSQPQTDVGISLVVKTATKTTYPTTAGAYYYCQVCRVGGTETEGGAGVITPVSGRHLLAFNIGWGVPPSGTVLIAHYKDGRYVINYSDSP